MIPRQHDSQPNFSTASLRDWAHRLPVGVARYVNSDWKFARHFSLINQKLIDLAARRISRLMIWMPPLYGKTTMTIAFVAWYLSMFRDHHVGVGAHDASAASFLGGRIRDVFTAHGGELWGLGIDRRNRSNEDWSLTGFQAGMRKATGGVQSVAIGAALNMRTDLQVIDDPIKQQDRVLSDRVRQRYKDWYATQWRQKRNINAAELMFTSRWHDDDMAGWLLQQPDASEWTVLNLPALAVTDDELGREVDEPLWPEVYPLEHLHRIRDADQSGYWWSALYQQKPVTAIATDGEPIAIPFQTPSIPLKEFCRQAWRVVEPQTPLDWNWHHDVICDHLEAVSRGEIDKLIINIPPRCSKSLIVNVFWPAWEWTWRPARRFLTGSYAQKMSTRDAVKMRRIIDSTWYQAHWGNVFQLMADQNAKARFENNMTGLRVSTSVGASATGEGGDAIVVDDPLAADNENSDAEREGANEWYKGTMSTRANTASSVFVVIMQRLHENDLTGALIKEGGYKTLIIPMEYEGVKEIGCLGHQDPRTTFGELMWPSRFAAKTVAGLKVTLGSYRYSGQFQQRPAPESGGVFSRENWRFWRPRGVDLPPWPLKNSKGEIFYPPVVELPQRFHEIIQSWDLTFDGSGSHDVGGHWGKFGADCYLLALERGQWEFPEQLKAIRRFAQQKPLATAKLIERAANAKAIHAVTRANIPGIILRNVEGDKKARARSVSAYHEAGNWIIPHPALFPWVEAYMHEHEVFDKGVSDDMVDMSSQALRYLHRFRTPSTGVGATRSSGTLGM